MVGTREHLWPSCLVCQEVMGASGCPTGAKKSSYAQGKLLLHSWVPHLSSSCHFTQQLEQTSPFSQRSCLDLLSSFSFSPSAFPWSSILTPLHEMAFACDHWYDLKSKAIVPLTLTKTLQFRNPWASYQTSSFYFYFSSHCVYQVQNYRLIDSLG